MPDVRPKIHPPNVVPLLKSRLKSVLGVRSSYVEHKYGLTLNHYFNDAVNAIVFSAIQSNITNW